MRSDVLFPSVSIAESRSNINNTRDKESRKKDSPGAPMVPYEVRQVGWRAPEAPERGAPWGADGGWRGVF